MKKIIGVVLATTAICVTFMIEGALIAIGLMRQGVSFDTPTGIVFEVQTEGHNFELVGE